MMRVLVTGHNGYIGVVLVPLLQEAGHEVVGLDSNLFDECTFGSGCPASVVSIRKDVRDVTASDLEGFDAVLHLAGISNDPLGDLNPDCTYEINYRATVEVARLAKRVGVPRFVFSSSCSIYGAAGDEILDENATFNPVTAYGHSKVLAEHNLAQLADRNFSPTYLRNATAYGVSCRLRGDLVMNNLMGWAVGTGRIFIKTDGTPWRPIVHIEDIARAFLVAIEAPRDVVHNQAFNVGVQEENYQVRDLAEIVHKVAPECVITYGRQAGPDKRNYRVDFKKIMKMLPAYKPQWNARRGAQQLYDAYKHAGLTMEDIEGPKYVRIQHIKQLQAEGRIDDMLRWISVKERSPRENSIVRT